MKTIRGSQHALVAIKTNHVARTIQERGAVTALGKMPIERRSLVGIEIIVDIIGDISPDFFAAYSHGFLTSFEAHLNRPSCPRPGARMSLSIKRARRSLLFTAPGDIPKIADVSEMVSSWISRSTNASR